MPDTLVKALSVQKITMPFPVQSNTLPDSLAGRDILGRGKTGSGKTLAFVIPLLARLSANKCKAKPKAPVALILAPTRELVNQIKTVLEPLAKATFLKTTTIFGGVSQEPQVRALQRGVDIVVACPGRLEDLIGQGHITLDSVQITVLDEADHMADLGFLPAVSRLLKQVPRTGQKMLFSATLDRGVDKLVKAFLVDSVMHSVDDETSHVEEMTHHIFEVSSDDKKPLIYALASGTGKRILFTRTKHKAKKLARQLTNQGIPAVDLHGNLSQTKRDRNLAAFGNGEVRVMVATDVAARGVHVDSIELVVHVDPPVEHKSYLHRSGRTARAGKTGDVVTIVLPEERQDTLRLLRKAAIDVCPVHVQPNSDVVQDLVGTKAPFVKPKSPNGVKQSAKPKPKNSHTRKGNQNKPKNGRPNNSKNPRKHSKSSSNKRHVTQHVHGEK